MSLFWQEIISGVCVITFQCGFSKWQKRCVKRNGRIGEIRKIKRYKKYPPSKNKAQNKKNTETA
jgi:hypothetical protein